MISERNKEAILIAYGECETEVEREQTVNEMSILTKVNTMEIRQFLHSEGLYKKVEKTKTEKEQLANALSAVTQVEAREWMKFTAKAQRKMWKFIIQMNGAKT